MIKNKLTFFFIILLISLAGAGYWCFLDYQKFLKNPLSLPHLYTLKKGMGIHALIYDLKEKSWLPEKQTYYFRLLAKLEGGKYHLKAGKYNLKQEITPIQLLQILDQGKAISYHLTLIEGWSIKEVLQALAQSPQLIHQIKDSETNLMALINQSKLHPEGQFFPDTYAFSETTTDIQFLKRSQQKMQKILAQEWAQRAENLPLKSPYEALILASIIEKESALASERNLIAGVFIKRLKKGMRLQTDPTVIYGMGALYHGNIRRKDLRKDTPYNTYTRKGLPPTPICMPGQGAIHAALHPENKGYLYFVAKGKTGAHYFSKTLREHNRAVRKYQ